LGSRDRRAECDRHDDENPAAASCSSGKEEADRRHNSCVRGVGGSLVKDVATGQIQLQSQTSNAERFLLSKLKRTVAGTCRIQSSSVEGPSASDMGPVEKKVSDELAKKLCRRWEARLKNIRSTFIKRGTVAKDETSSGVEYGICVYCMLTRYMVCASVHYEMYVCVYNGPRRQSSIKHSILYFPSYLDICLAEILLTIR
jgi:hypothetical protein